MLSKPGFTMTAWVACKMGIRLSFTHLLRVFHDSCSQSSSRGKHFRVCCLPGLLPPCNSNRSFVSLPGHSRWSLLILLGCQGCSAFRAGSWAVEFQRSAEVPALKRTLSLFFCPFTQFTANDFFLILQRLCY